MKLASFDIEICDEIDFNGGEIPRISCAALALQDSPDGEVTFEFFQSPPDDIAMSPEQVTAMASRLLELADLGYNIVTWNGVAFDIPTVAHFAEQKEKLYWMSWANHIDMMLLVSFQTGYRLGLDAALAGAGLESKLHNVTLSTGEALIDMSGAKAPELWRAGERQAVLDYLKVDVMQPLLLARNIAATNVIYWTSKKGRPMAIPTPLLTVAVAYKELPKPKDLSWLSDPIEREEYIKKYISHPAKDAARSRS